MENQGKKNTKLVYRGFLLFSGISNKIKNEKCPTNKL